MKNEKGITLIALIVTIIVMLILVAVTVTVAINGGLFEKADDAATGTEEKAIYDQIVSAMVLTENGKLNVASMANNAIADLKGKGYTVSPEEVTEGTTQATLTVTGKKGTYKYTITGEKISIGELEQKPDNPEKRTFGDLIEANKIYCYSYQNQGGGWYTNYVIYDSSNNNIIYGIATGENWRGDETPRTININMKDVDIHELDSYVMTFDLNNEEDQSFLMEIVMTDAWEEVCEALREEIADPDNSNPIEILLLDENSEGLCVDSSGSILTQGRTYPLASYLTVNYITE